MQSKISHKKSDQIEISWKRKNDQLVLAGVKGVPVTGESGEVQYIVVLARDITERKQTEREERYRILTEISPNSIPAQQEGEMIYANPAAMKMLGAKTVDEVIGSSILKFMHLDYKEEAVKRLEQMLMNYIEQLKVKPAYLSYAEIRLLTN